MNLWMAILSIILILLVVFWWRYKLKTAKEVDLIEIGFGIQVKREAYDMSMEIALIICTFLLLVALSTS